MANAADDFAAIRRAMREHEAAEMANWMAMPAGESMTPTVCATQLYSIFVHGDGDHVTFTPIATVAETGGLAVVEADSLDEAKIKLAKGQVVSAASELYSVTDYAWPEPKA